MVPQGAHSLKRQHVAVELLKGTIYQQEEMVPVRSKGPQSWLFVEELGC